VAVAVLAGLNGKTSGRRVLLVLPLAWIAGGCVASLFSTPLNSELVSAAAFLMLGVLVATDRPLKPTPSPASGPHSASCWGWISALG
jgi:hypothetical protein